MNSFVIFPVIFYFLHTSAALNVNLNSTYYSEIETIYLIKQRWHTALVFKPYQIDTTLIPEAKNFSEYEFIDFGWGDAEFYQIPGFDSGLAFKALFYATPSTIRIEGIALTKEYLINYSEIVIELEVNQSQIKRLNEHIANTIARDEDGNSSLLSDQASGKIRFYKSDYKYHMFYTCNTWIAEALRNAGFEIEYNILLAEQLFNEAANVGKVIKAPAN